MLERGPRFIWLYVAFAVILSLLAVGSITDDDVAALPGHSLHVSLHPNELDCKVTQKQDGAVTFGGNVTVEKPQGVERVTVTLSGECENGWPIVLSQKTIPFINPGTSRFSVTVVVPGGTTVSSGLVTVHAHASSLIWDEDQYAEARVNVLQYFKMVLWCSQPLYESDPGDTVIGKLYVNNSGNGEDTFAIALEQPVDGISAVQFSDEQLTVPPGFYAEFTFTVHIDGDLDVGMDSLMMTFILKVTSQRAGEAGLLLVKTYPLYIYFQGFEDQLYEEWPTYVGYGVVAALILVPVVFILRRRKRRREEDAEPIEVEQ